MDTTTVYYLASGTVLMGVISIGCTISSPVIANAKSEGHVDYIRALPIPRILISLADLCIWLIAILPGVFISFILGCLRFSVQLNLSILSVFVMLLICLTMISLGFSIAYIFSQNIVTLMSQLILMIGLMFSCIYHVSGKSSSDWLDQLYYLLPFVLLQIESFSLELAYIFYRHGTYVSSNKINLPDCRYRSFIGTVSGFSFSDTTAYLRNTTKRIVILSCRKTIPRNSG